MADQKKNVPVNTPVKTESKADKFKRLSAYRVNKIIKDCMSLGKLGGANYEKTAEQIDTIEQVTSDALAAALAQLQNAKSEKTQFSW
jgi:hypothetical protein